MRSALHELLESRPAFSGTTEAEFLAEITNRHLRYGQVDWLEIGAGDGRNLSFLMRRLATGRAFNVVALEPAAVAVELADVEWRRVCVEDYALEGRFDWMNMRHSAYYMGDPVAEIRRLAGALKEGGALALTHWSRGCVLHRLHVAICGEAIDTPTCGVEDLVVRLAEQTGLIVSEVVCIPTRLDADRVKRDLSVAEALYELARREREPLGGFESDRAGRIRSLLRTMKNATRRLNGIVLVCPR